MSKSKFNKSIYLSAAILIAGTMMSTPTVAKELIIWVENVSYTAMTTNSECYFSDCEQFDSDCGGYPVISGSSTVGILNDLYHSGKAIAVFDANANEKLCSYRNY